MNALNTRTEHSCNWWTLPRGPAPLNIVSLGASSAQQMGAGRRKAGGRRVWGSYLRGRGGPVTWLQAAGGGPMPALLSLNCGGRCQATHVAKPTNWLGNKARASASCAS